MLYTHILSTSDDTYTYRFYIYKTERVFVIYIIIKDNEEKEEETGRW